MGLILLFAGRSVSKLFKSSGIKGLDGIVNSEAAAKIKPPVTRYPGNRKYIPAVMDICLHMAHSRLRPFLIKFQAPETKTTQG